MAESVITEEMSAAVGVDGPESVSEVTTTGIRMFARAVGHSDPIFYDKDDAKRRGYRDLVAPPGYLGTARYRPDEGGQASPGAGGLNIPYKRVLNGGTRYQYFEPVVAGDVITSRIRISELREREGSIGPMLIIYRETTHTNQDGAVVAKMYGNTIHY